MPGSEKKWADVVFTQPPAGMFTYAVPPEFRMLLQPGQRVLVRLGSRKMAGFLVQFRGDPQLARIREIEDIIDSEPLITEEMLKLTRWVSDYYMSTWGEAVRAALPPGIQQRTRLMVEAVPGCSAPSPALSAQETQLLDLIGAKGSVPFQNLTKAMPLKGARCLLAGLEKRGLVTASQVLEEAKVAPKIEKWITAGSFPDDLEAVHRKAPRQAAVIETLLQAEAGLPRSAFTVPLSTLKKMEDNGWICIAEKETERTAFSSLNPAPAPSLTLSKEQSDTFNEVRESLRQSCFQVFLIHGVTASGKTQVYIEAVRETLALGKTALILIPEISLTPQAVQRYRAAFGDQVAILHSRMSMGERYDSWRRIKAGDYRIALGPRSAIFAPLENLGLIVIDEEHDGSYKQADPAPRYHARDTAVMRAYYAGCCVILGSATPSLETYYNARKGKFRLCELKNRIDDVEMPRISLVDLNEEDQAPSGRVFSDSLISSMGRRLDAGEQVILLQNRRGYSTLLRCRQCGAIAKCRHCDISLTFHQYDNDLKCHYCGYRTANTGRCAECGGEAISFQGAGTQRVQEALITLFPQATVLRMDQDSTRGKGSHERIVRDFEAGHGDILLGTQMIAKGHDFAGVNLVGVISADTGLHFPDFRAGERTFQLLTQTSGRAGRRDLQGEVIIQTRSMDHPVLQLVKAHDFETFYQRELEQRRELGYPPWGRMALIRLKGEQEAHVRRGADMLRGCIHSRKDLRILGPAPCPIPRIKRLFRYQIILRIPRETDPAGNLLRQSVRAALKRMQRTSLPAGVRISIDIDPLDTL